MLKVVVADDEARVCDLILLLADWGSLGMEVVGTAANGLEALQLVRTLIPDILITDIRMPGCYGLELIEKAKAEFPALEIVIISGYAHFEYAQSAIKNGVGDYLLKPIQRDELMATLEKLGERCRARRESATEVEQMKETSRQDTDRQRQRLIEDLAEGRLEELTEERLRGEYRVDIQPGLFQIFLLKLDYDLDAVTPLSIAIVESKAQKIFSTAIPGLCHEMLLSFREPWGYGLLNFPVQNRESVRRALRDCLNQLTVQQSLLGPIEFSLALGQASNRPEDLLESLNTARFAASERLIEGTGRLLEGAFKSSALREENLPERYGRAIEHLVETLSPEEADAAAGLLEEGAGEMTGVCGQELLELVDSAGQLFALRLDLEDREKIIRDFSARCAQCSKAADLFRCLRQFQREQLALTAERRRSESIRPIRFAKQYIQKHYSEPVTLEEVCAAIGFSTSYFSVLFKKETGEGFNKYLTRVRMDRAKELLQGGNLPIAEICSKVGYGDLKHFTQTFKKVAGLNPGQYRKLYG